MGKHDHAFCEHLVAWCRHCDTVFCQNTGCDMEWVLPCTRPHMLGMSGGIPYSQLGVIAGNVQGGNAIPGPIRADQIHVACAGVHGAMPGNDPYQKPGHTHHTPWVG